MGAGGQETTMAFITVWPEEDKVSNRLEVLDRRCAGIDDAAVAVVSQDVDRACRCS